MKPSFTYEALLERIVDADTFDVELDLGMRVTLRVRLRLAGVNAPEMSTEAGRVATSYLKETLPVGSRLVVRTYKPDKYGRALADVATPHIPDLAMHLVHIGYATTYEG